MTNEQTMKRRTLLAVALGVLLSLLVGNAMAAGGKSPLLKPVGDEPNASGTGSYTAKRIVVHGASGGYGWEGQITVKCSGLTPGANYTVITFAGWVGLKPQYITDSGVADAAGSVNFKSSYRSPSTPTSVAVYRNVPGGKALVLSGSF
jgi:hypothetical protein